MKIVSHRDWQVFQRSFQATMDVFELTKSFPREETYSLTDQVRRSSRSVAANLTKAWRKRRYEAAFLAKLSDAETEAAETQTWIDFAVQYGYLKENQANPLLDEYEQILRMIVSMINNPQQWVIYPQTKR
jgi:four helix bundle protein